MPDPSPRRLFLIGPMGAGKSTLGRYLARQLSWPFYDSDREIERRTGADIPWIFDMEGEDGFRLREESVVDELTELPEVVLATGGGVVKRELNRRRLHDRGLVVYLWTPVETQLERTRHDRNRPLLQNSDPKGTLKALFEERDPLYREVAHHVISTESGNLREVAGKVLACMGIDATG